MSSPVRITLAQALAWRLDRHFLTGDGARGTSVEHVVERLTAVPAFSGDPQIAIGVRLDQTADADLAAARRDGRILKTYAYRGTTHLMTPAHAGIPMALRASSRMWERASWRSYYQLEATDWPDLRAAVREALADGPLTRDSLVDAVTATPRFAHLRAGLSDDSQTLLKPFAWQGDLCFAPPGYGAVAFQRPDTLPGWQGIPPLDEAGPAAITAYLQAYGPADDARLKYWLGEGLGVSAKRIGAWIAALGEEVVEVDVDGQPRHALAEHADDLAATQTGDDVALLAGHDQWVLGPGTADATVVPTARRSEISRGANLLVDGGVAAGTWKVTSGVVTVDTFEGAARPDAAALEKALARLGHAMGEDVHLG
ncbi:DNA glycosylase AlkZ-like family protein [Demequina sp.]|uniref:DNA glycosylase AlkZ-like family protein n=1 Tax=Demequina sp. TaxID=2050685 RepID=UPI003A8AAE12